MVVGGLAVAVIHPDFVAKPTTEAMMREMLQTNPGAVLEALRTLRTRYAEESRSQQRDAILSNRSLLLEDANSPVLGNPKGDVTMVAFLDYRCPYCRQAMSTIQAMVRSDPKLRLIYKEFPILGPQSVVAARLAIAARKDPRYPALHDALMTAPGPLSEETVLQIAADLGLDRAVLAKAMKAPDVEEILKANYAVSRALGIQGTPAFVIGDTLAPGVISLDEMKKLVARARAEGGDQMLGKAGG
jgi:protein-disulfide isomerase